MMDTRIATNISKDDGTKPIGAKAASEIVETVLSRARNISEKSLLPTRNV